MGCFHLPFISCSALSCVVSPFATTSFRCLSCALMTSSAVSPWCGKSHGPPNCLHVIVFTGLASFHRVRPSTTTRANGWNILTTLTREGCSRHERVATPATSRKPQPSERPVAASLASSAAACRRESAMSPSSSCIPRSPRRGWDHGAAVGQVAQMALESGETSDRLASELERRHAVRDALLRLRDDRGDRVAQLHKRRSLGLVRSPEVVVDLFL